VVKILKTNFVFSPSLTCYMNILCQTKARRKAMMLAFDKHNNLMSDAQEGNGEFHELS